MKTGHRAALDFIIPFLVLVIATAVLAITGADIRIESFFYQPGAGWTLTNDEPWHALYRYGALPGLLLGGGAVVVFMAGFFSTRLSRFRRPALYFVLLLALGPGLLTSVLKTTWGRPRPRQIETFGGEKKFLQVWQRDLSGEGKSFPSSHAAIAFYLFSPFLALRRSFPRWAIFFLVLGLVYGLFMGLARMIQGGHFPSDVLWAAGIDYLTGLSLYYVLRMHRDQAIREVR